MSKLVQAYGSWISSIQADQLISGQVNPTQLQCFGDSLYWLEPRPEQKGRTVLIQHTPGSSSNNLQIDLLPADKSVRSRVHEYGGKSYHVCERGIIFVNQSDQQLYLRSKEGDCKAITNQHDCRFVDMQTDHNNQYIICVCEQHITSEPNLQATNSQEPINTLVSINIDTGEISTLAQGDDFYASPNIDSNIHFDEASQKADKEQTQKLCWISWSHPDMPWDHTRLWTANFTSTGTLQNIRCIRDNPDESIFQPIWSPTGDLTFVSDISDWWNIYSDKNGSEPLINLEAEFGLPQWVFGMSTYSFIDNNTIGCSYIENGKGMLATIDLTKKTLKNISTKLTHFDQITSATGILWFVGSSPTTFPTIHCYSVIDKTLSTIRTNNNSNQRWQPDANTISQSQTIHFDTSNNQTAHAFYYPPINPDFTAAANELPPLIVMSHGGPTAFSDNSLSLKIQFWTSRGFAVCDVNYRGSTGYGRPYRDALKGQWGIADVEDCVYAARHLVKQKLADQDKLIIRGSSAGGYSVLCALTYHNDFKAGASYYGISDLSVLAEDTHKFEARYLDKLIGPWPEAKDIYTKRSPINAVDQLNCPVIFFQGLQDKVVPPNQAEDMVNALKDKGLTVAYITYAEEQHGFRQAETIKHSLQTELEFYGKVFGFDPA